MELESNECLQQTYRRLRGAFIVSDRSPEPSEMEKHMKKFLLVTVGLVALGMAAPASAADLAARPYTKAPPMVDRGLRLERLLHRCQRRLGIEPQVLGYHELPRRNCCAHFP
jgi:hypothetical protein